MRRGTILVFLFLALTGPATAARAQAPAPTKIVILWLDATSLEDWSRPDLPNFAAFLRRGALALLSTRTRDGSIDPRDARASAAVSVGAGARAAFDPLKLFPRGSSLGVLGGELKRAGITGAVVGDADGSDNIDRNAAYAMVPIVEGPPPGPPYPPVVPSPPGASTADPNFPTGRRADIAGLLRATQTALTTSRVVLVDFGDTARVARAFSADADAAEPWLRLSMRRADALLAGLVATGANVISIAPTTTPSRAHAHLFLGAAAIAGPGIRPGLLSSPTTRRKGVLSLEDIAPTILNRLALGVPDGIEGRSARFHRSPGALASALRLEGEVVHAARARRPLTRTALAVAMLVAVLSLATVISGRGCGARATRIPRGWRDVLATLLLATVALPLGLYIEGAFPTRDISSAIAAVAVFALGLAVCTRASLGRERALMAILIATAAVPLLDLLIGSPLGHRSALSFQIAGGGRFYGLNDDVLGVIVGAALFGAALALDRARNIQRMAIVVAGVLIVAAQVMGSPLFGAKFGAPLTAVPAFGVLATRALGLRLGRRAFFAITAATLFTAGVLAWSDTLLPSGAQSHVARAAGEGTQIWDTLTRKVVSSARITAFTIWARAFLVLAGAVALIAWRRRQLFDRGMWGRPHLRAGILAAAVASAAALVAQDGGITAAAMIALEGSIAVLLPLVAPDP